MALSERGISPHPDSQPQLDLIRSLETERDSTIAIIAPGQGGQKVGMGVELAQRSPAAARIWEIAGDVLGGDFLDVVKNGPQETLDQTRFTQPAVVLDSLARRAALEELGTLPPAEFYTGNSLGFYTALISVGSLSVADGFKIVKRRGEISEESNSAESSSMVAVKGISDETQQALYDQFGLVLCLDNSTSQKVYGGEKANIEEAAAWLKSDGRAGGVYPLAVDGAFHSRWKQPAVAPLKEALAHVDLRTPQYGTLIGIDTVGPLTTTDEITQEMLGQLVHTVRWRETINYLRQQGVSTMVELGDVARLTNFNIEEFGGERERIAMPRLEDGVRPPNIVYKWAASNQ